MISKYVATITFFPTYHLRGSVLNILCKCTQLVPPLYYNNEILLIGGMLTVCNQRHLEDKAERKNEHITSPRAAQISD